MRDEFRLVKVSLAEVQIAMLDQLAADRGTVTRSELFRSLILSAFAELRHRPVPINPRREDVSVIVGTKVGEFLAVIDTGSDHTLVPEKYAKGFEFTGTKPIWTLNAVKRHQVYEGELDVLGKRVEIKDAMLVSGDVGILGLDVLEHLEVFIKRGKATVKLI